MRRSHIPADLGIADSGCRFGLEGLERFPANGHRPVQAPPRRDMHSVERDRSAVRAFSGKVGTTFPVRKRDEPRNLERFPIPWNRKTL
jgi:hypothetical protein